jgi:hypothetical protein
MLRDWKTQSVWRERIQLSDYLQFRVRNGEQLWRSQSLDFQPTRVFQLEEALRPRIGSPRKKDTIHSVTTRNIGDESVQCVHYTRFQEDSAVLGQTHLYCVGKDTESLRFYQNKDFSVAYSKFTKLGEWNLPTLIEVFEQGKRVLQAELQVSPLPEIADSDFREPSGAHIEPICQDYVPAYVAMGPRIWNPAVPANLLNGRVTVWLKLNEKGRILKTFVGEEGTKDMNTVAIEGLHRSAFEPAKCDGKSVPSETHVTWYFGEGTRKVFF